MAVWVTNDYNTQITSDITDRCGINMNLFTLMCFSGALVSMQMCGVREQQQGDFVICVCGLSFYFFMWLYHRAIGSC